MHDLTVFSPQREAAAIAAMEEQNAQMSTTLDAYARALMTAASLHRSEATEAVRLDLWDWCRDVLLVHVRAEEEELYPRASAEAEGRLLVDGMMQEHDTIRRLVRQVRDADDGVHAVAAASALVVMLESHLRKENEQLLPLLARSPYVSLADLLAGLRELAGDRAGVLARADYERSA